MSAQIVILTILIPITLYFLLRSLGKVDSIMVTDIGQRRFPLVAQALLFFLILQQSIPMHHTPELYFFFLGAFLTTILSLISVFLRFKSSLHMAGMGGLVFFVIGLSLHNVVNIVNTVAFLFAISGLVAASRLQMRAHSQPELWVGFLLGMVPQLLLWSFWL